MSQWSAPATVTITTTPAVQLHVGDLDGTKTVQTSTWTAKVTIRVHDAAEASISGVTVTGVWSNGATGTGTCKTASTGLCTLQKPSIPKTTTNVTFTVTGPDVRPDRHLQPGGQPRSRSRQHGHRHRRLRTLRLRGRAAQKRST